MRLNDILRQAVRPLAAYKLRTTLTLLGILIGVAAVISLTTLMQSASTRVTGRVQNLGTNLVIVTMNPLVKASNSQHDLTIQDAHKLGRIAGFQSAAAVDYETTAAAHNAQRAGVTVYGAGPDLTGVLKYQLAKGRFLTHRDEHQQSRVALLGADTSKRLFGAANPVGRHVVINHETFRVVGLLAPKGDVFSINQDAVAVIPITTYQTQSGIHAVDSVYLKTQGASASPSALHQLRRLLNRMVGGSDRYTIMTQSEILSVTQEITQVLTQVLAGVAAISILVGGIGMLNVLFISVSERVKEIGVRKSLGARRVDILWQFMAEAMLVSTTGGLLGAAAGMAASWALTQEFHLAMTLHLWLPAEGVMASAALGMVFGIVPAMRAAWLVPAAALRID